MEDRTYHIFNDGKGGGKFVTDEEIQAALSGYEITPLRYELKDIGRGKKHMIQVYCIFTIDGKEAYCSMCFKMKQKADKLSQDQVNVMIEELDRILPSEAYTLLELWKESER